MYYTNHKVTVKFAVSLIKKGLKVIVKKNGHRVYKHLKELLQNKILCRCQKKSNSKYIKCQYLVIKNINIKRLAEEIFNIIFNCSVQ